MSHVLGQIGGINMDVDFDAIGCVVAGLVEKDVSTRYEEQLLVAGVKETRSVREFELSRKSCDSNAAEE